MTDKSKTTEPKTATSTEGLKPEAPGAPAFYERERDGTAPIKPEDYPADEKITPSKEQTGEANPRVVDPGAAASSPAPEVEHTVDKASAEKRKPS